MSCKKKEKEADNKPIVTNTPTSDTLISFRSSLFNSTKKGWDKPEAYTVAPGYESEKTALLASSLLNTFLPPCDDYYFDVALNYTLQLRKNVLDTIIMRNVSGVGEIVFQAKFTYDLTQSPAILKSIKLSSVSSGVVCSSKGPNRMSFGYH